MVGTGFKVELEGLLAQVEDDLLGAAVETHRGKQLFALRVAVAHAQELSVLREEHLARLVNEATAHRVARAESWTEWNSCSLVVVGHAVVAVIAIRVFYPALAAVEGRE